MFEGHLKLLAWINTRKWYIPLSALSHSEVCVYNCEIEIISRFGDLGKSLATSLVRSMLHGSVEEPESLFYNLTSPWCSSK